MSDAVKIMVDALRGVQAQSKMPFPNDYNPDMMFNNRFPVMQPAGVMNDLKPAIDTGPILARKFYGG